MKIVLDMRQFVAHTKDMNSPQQTTNAAQAASFQVGDVVVNFGVTAKVVAFHQDGSLILRRANGRQKWLALAAKCTPAS